MAGQVRSLSVVGRGLEDAIGTPQAAWLKALLLHPQLAVIRRHANKAVYLFVAYSAAKRLLPRLWALFTRARSGVPTSVAPVELSPGGIPPNMMPKVNELVASEDGSVMWKEMIYSALVAVASSMLLIRKAFLLGRLIDLQNSPETRALWRWYAWQFPLNALAITFLQELSNYIRSRTALKWTRAVTRKIHDLYFSGMGYYRLHNRGKDMAVEDPDVRICNDIKSMCESNAGIAFSLCNAVVFTAAFGRAVIQGRDWKWSLLTPAFYGVALYWLISSEPHERWTLQFELANVESRYSQLVTRLQLHAERICMLQGERFETALLSQQIGKIHHLGKRLREILFKRDLAENIIFNGQGPPALIEQTGWLMGSIMTVNDVIAGATAEGNAEHLPLDRTTPYWHSSGALGNIVNQLWAFYNTCNSWGTVVSAYFSMQNAEAGNVRVQELYGSLLVLKTLGNKENARVFLDQGPVISFDGVCVRTPTGQQLLQDLTFQVEEGQMLLVCGHNGAGKSSIIRCLCALWPVPQGKITRPGGAASAEDNVHLHNEMYYLPQKPCNVLGTLSDQLTYPEKCELPEKELRKWLRYVDLEHLADRKIGTDAISRVKSSVLSTAQEAVDHVEDTKGNEIDWEVLLSLGEQQALSIARLLYHRPRFAILDECTSAVGKVLERRLFEIAREIGISCISITHRPALKEHHERMLMLTGRLAEDGRGWNLSDLPSATKHKPVRERPADLAEVHKRIEACIAETSGSGNASQATDHELEEQRSKMYLAKAGGKEALSAEDLVKRKWPSSLSRFVAVLRLGLKDRQLQRHAALRVALMFGILRVRLSFGWMMWRGLLGWCTAAICGDPVLLFSEFATGCVSTIVYAALDQWFRLEVNNLGDELWRSVTMELQEQMQKGISFMKVMNPPGPHIPTIENPMQRLTELKKLFGTVSSQVISVVIPMSQAFFLLPTMFRGVGLWAPFLLAMNYVAFRTAQLFAPDFAKIQSVQATLESRFQVLHTRLKAISEPVAFSGAGAAERRIIEPRFDAIMKYSLEALRKQFLYNMVVTFFTDYGQLPIWTHRLMAITYVAYNNPTDPRGSTPVCIGSNVLFDRSTQFTQIWVQRCVMFLPEWRRIDAYCNRVLQLVEGLNLASKDEEVPWAAGSATASQISIRGLDLVTRHGRCLAKGLSFDIGVGQPTLVTGPNATGKSLLGSILLGLWAPAGPDKELCIPGALGARPPLSTIMPAPQRIYLPVGTLYIQLMYPVVPDHDVVFTHPYKLLCYDYPEGTTTTKLFMHFVALGCTSVEFAKDEATGQDLGYAFAFFDTLDSMLYAAARPQDRWLGESQFKTDFWWAADEHPEFATLARMGECLRAVGIEHVHTRESLGWVAERPWEDVLSGGEQQRLCFARVLVHQPKFALLDECTSMVAADAEAELYRRLFQDFNITPLTLTQRPFMHDLYAKDLSLGVRTASGWEFADLQENSPAG